MLTINLIGAGKLGQILGYLWSQTQEFKIAGILNQSQVSGQAAFDFIGQGEVIRSFAELPAADISLIAVPDSKIADTTTSLYQAYTCPENHVIFHCAASLPADILRHPKRKDIHYGCVHPIYSFKPSTPDNIQFAGSLCGIDALSNAKIMLEKLFTSIGAQTFPLPQNKALYHAGCVFASNYLVSLAADAMSCFESAGMPSQEAHSCVHHLMQTTLRNLGQQALPLNALTGPLQRGDINTIKLHLDALKPFPQQKNYQTLGLALIEKLKTQDNLNPAILDCFHSA